MMKYRVIILALAVLISFGSTRLSLAAPVQDDALGTWTNEFGDTSGMSAISGITVTGDVARLTDLGGGVYPSSGQFTLGPIEPAVIGRWNQLAWVATTPTNTTVSIQFRDNNGNAFGNGIIPGNATGNTVSPVSLSAVPIDRHAITTGSGKVSRVYLRVTLSTTDTSVTPSLDAVTLSWLLAQGDVSASGPSTGSYPTYTGGQTVPLRGTYAPGLGNYYPAIRWVKTLDGFPGGTVRGLGNTIYARTVGGTSSVTGDVEARIMSLNRLTGATQSEARLSGNAFTSTSLTVSANQTLYSADNFQDWLYAYDGLTMTPKFLTNLLGGHGSDQVLIGDDGTLFVWRTDINGDFRNRLVAINPSGTIKFYGPWVAPAPAGDIAGVMSLNNQGDIVVATRSFTGGTVTNFGDVYKFSKVDGSLLWSYDSGSFQTAYSPPVIGPDDTIYLASSVNTVAAKSILALNTNGTLKWQQNLASSANSYTGMSLSVDGTKLFLLVSSNGFDAVAVETRSATNGALISTQALPYTNNCCSFTIDSSNGVIVGGTTSGLSGPSIKYFENGQTLKWTLFPGATGLVRNLSMDESGYLYAHRLTAFAPTADQLYMVAPWTLTMTTSKTVAVPGDTIAVTATTSMQQTNLITGGANKVQAVLGNQKVPMTYTGVDGNGNTQWAGTITVPSGATGTQTIIVQANADGVTTDIPVAFDTPATNSGNTGITAALNFDIPFSGGGGGSGGGKLPPIFTGPPVPIVPPVIIQPPVKTTDPVAGLDVVPCQLGDIDVQTKPVFELVNQTTGDGLYTTSREEARNVASFGYLYRRVIGGVYSQQIERTVPLYRLWKSVGNVHWYTNNEDEKNAALRQGFVVEGVLGYVLASMSDGVNPLPVWRMENNDGANKVYKLGTDLAVQSMARTKGFVDSGSVGYMCQSNVVSPSAGELYRLYDSSGKKPFYTTSAAERDVLVRRGFRFEGVIGVLSTVKSDQTQPLYRLYSTRLNNHLYTVSEEEKDQATRLGYRYERVTGYVWTEPKTGLASIYRLYNSGLGKHIYIGDESEVTSLNSLGYVLEGVVGYAVSGK